MKKGAYRRLFLLAACLAPAPALAETACHTPEFDEIARVRYVHDGDTVHLQDGRKIRLIGINAPELARGDMPDQAHAREARASLDAAITSSGDRVGLVHGADRQDRYKRSLAHLFTTDGVNLQARLLSQGMAVAIAHPPNLAFTGCYSEVELAARCSGKGIWSDPGQLFVRASTLENKHKGFRLVSGSIDHISLNDNGARIFMGKLMLGIDSDNLADFDKAKLLSLRGRRVTARGWLQPKRSKTSNRQSPDQDGVEFYMHIRHPSAIEINPWNGGAKC
jgi:endonuclease YncB( thermonuclease family)